MITAKGIRNRKRRNKTRSAESVGVKVVKSRELQTSGRGVDVYETRGTTCEEKKEKGRGRSEREKPHGAGW